MLISIEGIDGTGKTTLAKLLTTHYNTKYIKFPSENNEIGKLIKKILNDSFVLSFNEAVSLQMLFTINKMLEIENLSYSYSEIVIMDRYIDSALVYGYLDNIPLNYTYELNKFLPTPHLTLILDASPEICIERLRKRNLFDYYEDESKLKVLRELYKELPAIYKAFGVERKFVYLDAEKSIDEIFIAAVKEIDDMYSLLIFA